MPSRRSAWLRQAPPDPMSAATGVLGRRPPPELVGGWEVGLLVLMVLLYLGGAFVNPGFFGSVDAFHALLRDAARYAVMAVGMTFVIVNKDLDLSVGSIYGLITVVFSLAFRAGLLRSRPGGRGPHLPPARPGDRPDQRRARHHPARAGLHRDADHAAHRPRHRARPDRRQVDPLFGQGGRVPALLRSRRDQRPGLQQPDPDRDRGRRDRRLRAGQDPLGLRDLRHRRQRAGRGLRRHPDALGADPRLPDLVAVRHDRGPDGGRAGQGHDLAVRPRRRADRDRGGDHRRRLDPRRPRPGDRQLPRRRAHRADRQGPARGRADHPHDRRQRRRDAGQSGLLAAGRRGAGVSRPAPAGGRADRAACRAPPHAGAALGVAARQAAAARDRDRRRRARRRPDQGLHGQRQGAGRARLRQVPRAGATRSPSS